MERPTEIITTSGAAVVAAPSASPTSPIGPPGYGNADLKRKRSSMICVESSPGSMGGADGPGLDGCIDDEPDDKRLRQPGVKRACNECRQQKLRCTVIQDPFTACTRCVRLRLDCKIESNFKRVGKRSKQAEMAKQIEHMRDLLQQAKAKGFEFDEDELDSPITSSHYTHTRNPSLIGSEEAVSSLLHLRSGGGGGGGGPPGYNNNNNNNSLPAPAPFRYVLGAVELSPENVHDLFNEYFTFYHDFIPFLPRNEPPEQYFQQHPLLFWSVIAVGARRWPSDTCLIKVLTEPLTTLVWKTISDLPTNFYVVKALCLLCTWRLPASTTSSDPTHILCGVMMKLATGIGLHRPKHIQDFSRTPVDLNADQVQDRVVTWAVCNIVAQSVGTGYGQPASTVYDWTLAASRGGGGDSFVLPPALDARLRVEMFCDKVSKEMYSNASDARGLGDEHRSMLMRIYKREFQDLQRAIERDQRGCYSARILNLHLKAALLHLRLAAFYDSPATPSYIDDLTALWQATTNFLADITGEALSGPADGGGAGGAGAGAGAGGAGAGARGGAGGAGAGSAAGVDRDDLVILPYTSSYMQQMLVAGGFSLYKLLACPFFAPNVDWARGRELFHRTVNAIRLTSVTEHDLQWRLAELMVQMWNGHRIYRQAMAGAGASPGDETLSALPAPQLQPPIDDSLQLKVRCRHSMSLVFDMVWCWREEFLNQGRSSLEALRQATDPDSANESSVSSANNNNIDHPAMEQLGPSMHMGMLGGPTPGPAGSSILPAPQALSALPPPQHQQQQQQVSGPTGMLGGMMTAGNDADFGGIFDMSAHPWLLDNLLDFHGYIHPIQAQVEQQG